MRIVAEVKGGLIERIVSDGSTELEVVVMDYDTDMVEAAKLEEVEGETCVMHPHPVETDELFVGSVFKRAYGDD